jgi:hypothetical protein
MPDARSPLFVVDGTGVLSPVPFRLRGIGAGLRWVVVLLVAMALAVVVAGQLVAGSGSGVLVRTLPRSAGAQSISGWSALTPAVRGVVSATVGAAEPAFRVHAGAGGLTAVNPTQGLRARFGRDGMSVNAAGAIFGLRLSRIGYGTTLTRVAAVAPVGRRNRVTYVSGGVREWYANGPLGLEQGFTVWRPAAAASGPLTLALTLSGDLRASLTDSGRALVLRRGGRPVLAYRDLVAADARGRLLPAWLSLRGRRLEIRVDTRGAAFPVRIDPLVQEAELTASDASATNYDNLGAAVAVSSDGSTVVAGAAFQNPDGDYSQGAVYVFVKPAAGWASATQTAKLTVSGDPWGALGLSVAVSSTGSTVVAGAPGVDCCGGDDGQGAVYVFTEPALGWGSGAQPQQESAELTEAEVPSVLGYSVAVSADGSTVVAGDPGQGFINYDGDEGSAYVFAEPALGWGSGTQPQTPTAKLAPAESCEYPPCYTGDLFGESVAISGAGSTVVAGAPDDRYDAVTNSFNQEGGAAFVFTAPGGGWGSGSQPQTQTATLNASTESAASSDFGNSVGMSLDGATIAVGEPYQDQANGGDLFVFVEPLTGWASGTQTAELSPSTATSDLGDTLAISGDGSTVVGESDDGPADLFAMPGGGWGTGAAPVPQAQTFTGPSGAAFGQFTSSTALSDDGSTLAIGARGAMIGCGHPGAVFLFGTTAPAGGTGGSPDTIVVVRPDSGTVDAGDDVPVTAYAKTSTGTIDTGFNATASICDLTGAATTGTFVDGVLTTTLQISSAYHHDTLTVAPAGDPSGTSSVFNVLGPIGYFKVGYPGSPHATCTSFGVTVVAYDYGGNTLSNYSSTPTVTDSTGTVQVISSAPAGPGRQTLELQIHKAMIHDRITVADPSNQYAEGSSGVFDVTGPSC